MYYQNRTHNSENDVEACWKEYLVSDLIEQESVSRNFSECSKSRSKIFCTPSETRCCRISTFTPLHGWIWRRCQTCRSNLRLTSASKRYTEAEMSVYIKSEPWLRPRIYSVWQLAIHIINIRDAIRFSFCGRSSKI